MRFLLFPEELFFCDLPGMIRLLSGKGIVFVVGVIVLRFHGLLLMLVKYDRKQRDETPDRSDDACPQSEMCLFMSFLFFPLNLRDQFAVEGLTVICSSPCPKQSFVIAELQRSFALI